MSSGEPASSHLSPAEIADAIRALPDLSWVRLQRIARRYCFGRPIEPDDLLQEAFLRALDAFRPEMRRCPRHVHVVAFLAGVMRSIASDAAKAQKRHDAKRHHAPPELHLLQHTGEGDLAGEVAGEALTVEDELVRFQEAERIRLAAIGLFADDVEAQTMIEGIMEGVDGEELRAITELDKTAFASKRRLIRRRIEKAYPNGWTP